VQERRAGPGFVVRTPRQSYFLSRISLERGSVTTLPAWQQRLFIGLAHNAASPAAYFRLPIERTVVMGTQIEL
jgi:KUP system potassium uptake protein